MRRFVIGICTLPAFLVIAGESRAKVHQQSGDSTNQTRISVDEACSTCSTI